VSYPNFLPAEVAVKTSRWFGRARNYPIFSLPWYRYRSVAMLSGALLVILVFMAMIGLSQLPVPGRSIDPVRAIEASLVYIITAAAVVLIGPGLAVLVRRMRWHRHVETAALLAVLLFGMFISFGVIMKQALQVYGRPSYNSEHDVMVRDSAILLMFDVDVKRRPATAYAGLLDPTRARRYVDAYERYARTFNLPERVVDGWPEFMTEADRRLVAKLRDPSTTSAERRSLQEPYVELLERSRQKMTYMIWRAGQQARQAGQTRISLTPDHLAADRALLDAMRADPPPATLPDKALVRQMHVISLLAVVAVQLALLAWLGGVFDLIPFVRQRGMLGDVQARQELERARAARNDAEMRLSVLAAQVEPHFLFNTLASVRSALATDPQRAGHIVDHMVDYLRATIPQMRDHAASRAVTLDTQLTAVRAYLALMHERMQRLQFSVQAAPGLEKASIPPLMLISLVENAVKHGVEPKVGQARVDVLARKATANGEDQLEVAVLDDGVGFGATASGSGIGLANIQERLRTQFGQRASLELKARSNGGVAATLRVPLTFET
jgi:hypothetical protein